MFKKSLLAASLLIALPAFAAHGNHEEPTHIPGVFIGATNIDGETDFSWGFEYEYKFTANWGAGFVYEETPDGHEGAGTSLKIAEVYYHPTSEIRLGVGYGQEDVDSHGHHHSFDEKVWRASAGYDFHFGKFAIAPTIAFDRIDGDTATVFELAVLMPF